MVGESQLNLLARVRRAKAAGAWAVGLAVWMGWMGAAQGALQFDVFFGYGGIVREGSWFPLACEIKNDGPSFKGEIEVGSGTYSKEPQVQRVPIELPTGTLKRVFIPVFLGSRGYSAWDLRLLDERGHVRAEHLGERPNRSISADTPLLGAMARTPGGVPVFRPLLSASQSAASDLQPLSALLRPSIFPDNPLVLEGLASIYLNSSQASEIKVPQVDALYAWLNAGGHLIVGVEQLSDINSTPWLKGLFPCELKEMRTLKPARELEAWLASPSGLPSGRLRATIMSTRSRGRPGARVEGSAAFTGLEQDLAFAGAEVLVAAGTVVDGQTVLSCQEVPLMVTATRGRGRVTALLFSPEREPFRSWKNLPTFWTKLAEVPADWYATGPQQQVYYGGGTSTDGIFGAMLDSRQVHKLPVEWLLVLLIVYLVVIGPLDQYWLKRIHRPMLTWITFPCYVVLFSLLIYFIGYKLRAGESEWNELHLVDVLLAGDHAEFRGRTYATIYSPSNQRYILESQQKYATLRGEFAGMAAGGASDERINLLHKGDSFKAEVFVPVWISKLYVSDWWQTAEVPLSISVTTTPAGWTVSVANQTDQKLANAQIAIEDRLFALGDVRAGESKSFNVARERGRGLLEFLSGYGSQFAGAAHSRGRAFASTEAGRINDLPTGSIAASFPSLLSLGPDRFSRFISPAGLDVSPVVEHGGAMFFAWVENYSPVKAINQFSPRRFHQNTLWRVATTVK